MAMNFIVTTQILEDQVRRGRFGASAGEVEAVVPSRTTSTAR
jgi:hypothetical protein